MESATMEAPPGVAKEKVKLDTRELALRAVERNFPPKSSVKRKVAFLFTEQGAFCFRVNYLNSDSIESHYVRVLDGQVEVAPEAPCRPLEEK